MRLFRTLVKPKDSFGFFLVVTLFIACRAASAQILTATTPTSAQAENRSLADYSASAPSEWELEPTISGGYSNVHFNGKNAIPYNPQGGYIDINSYARMPNYDSPVIGLGLSASGNWDDYAINYPTSPFFRSFYADMSLFSLEVRVAFPFGLPNPDHGFYCLPRIGVGALISNFTVGQPYYAYPNYFFGAYSTHTGYALSVRPDIELGYRINRFNIGCEASYMAAWGDFGKLGNLSQEFRLGLVVGYRF
jgi:hypothetical protein